MKKDISQVMRAADILLGELDNPRHAAIIRNYRLHALLEISGQWKEIWKRGLIVDDPQYRMAQYGGFQVLEGTVAVQGFYEQAHSFGIVTMFEEEQIAVADWGFFSQFKEYEYIPGSMAKALLSDIVDCDFSDVSAQYLFSCRVEMSWDYDDRGLLKREKGHQDIGSFSCSKIPPEDFITREAAELALAPLIERASAR